jgi:gliding motility-associated-like protein
MGTLTANTNGDNIQWFKDGVILNGENDADLTVSESGEYSALVLGQTDCEVMASANVTVISAPTLTLDGDQSICINDSYMLDANTGVASDQYTYLYEGTAINVSNTTTMIEIDQEGQYEVIVTNENNCTATESITLTVNALPDVAIMGDATLCIGAMGQLVADGNGTGFAWTLNGNAVGTDNAQLDISQAGSYNVISTSAQGCINEAQYEVVSVDSPIIDLGDDLALCPGETVMIDAGSHITYAWSTGEDSPMINITSTDPTMVTTETISVVVTNSANCASTDELVVTFAPVISGSIVPSAPGVCPEGTLTLEAIGGLYYEWQDPSGTLSAIDMAIVDATPSENTSYEVVISDDCPNNIDVVSIEVPVFDGSNVSAGPDTCIVIGQKYEMQASGGVAYDWDNELTIFGSDMLANTEVGPEETTIYTVEITDANGCTYSDDVEICVVDDPLSIFKEISIITPNDDGKNDELTFPGLEQYDTNELIIFNRWGNIVFEQEDYQKFGELFNGTNGGEKLPADTYFYVLKFDGNTFKSAITIMYQ